MAEIGDVPVILGMIRALAEYERLSDQAVATEALLREHLFGARRAAEAMIAIWEGEAAGFSLYFQTFSTFVGRPGIWLEDLFVLPPYRSKGIGKALLLRVAEIAVERGCGRMEWSVLDWNEPAIGFYKKLGAVAMEDWTTYRVAGEALATLGGSDREFVRIGFDHRRRGNGGACAGGFAARARDGGAFGAGGIGCGG